MPEDEPTTVLGPEGPREPPPSRRLGWGLLAGILVIAGAAAAIAVVWLTGGDSNGGGTTAAATTRQTTSLAAPGQVLVPDVVGLDQADAAGRLAAVHLEPDTQFKASAKPTGKVIGQHPGAGTHVDQGSTVTVVVDRGAPKVDVPDVTGATLADARKQLQDAGLEVQTTEVSAGKPPGTVVSQAPEAGSKAQKGSSVTLSVVRGEATTTVVTTTTTAETTTTATTTAPQPATAEVPDVTGQFLADAADAFASAGIYPDVAYVPSDERPGTVVAQTKDAGTTVKRLSYVRINVAEGPDPEPDATVPNVKGMTRDDARSKLADAGFEVKVLERPVASSTPADHAVGEQPSGGSKIPGGATVVLIVGAH